MPELDSTLLERRWIHSHEEDRPDRRVFRPESWTFPPSRGRRSFTFGAGGRLVQGGPGPTDKTAEAGGRWRLLPGGVIELHPDGGSTSRLRVIELQRDKLVVDR